MSSHGDFHVEDPFALDPGRRARQRSSATMMMLVVGAMLFMSVTVFGNLGVRVPLLTDYPAVTSSVGLWLLITGMFRWGR